MLLLFLDRRSLFEAFEDLAVSRLTDLRADLLSVRATRLRASGARGAFAATGRRDSVRTDFDFVVNLRCDRSTDFCVCGLFPGRALR